jgi:hypothetical protein
MSIKRSIVAGASYAALLLMLGGWGWSCTIPAVPASGAPTNSSSVGPDRDHDGLSDDDEARLLTDPDNPDTDGDGCPDGLDDAPLLNSVSTCPQANSNSNANANVNSANQNANSLPTGGFMPAGDQCPFVNGFGLATEPGSGSTRVSITYGSNAGSVRVVLGAQTVTLGPGGEQMVTFADCPQTITLSSVTFDDGMGRLQTYSGLTFARGFDYSCGGTLTLTFTSSCNIALSEE